MMKQIKRELALVFDMVNIGLFAFYVSLKVTCDRKKKLIKLSQNGYIEKLLDQYWMLKAKTTKTPM